MATVSKFLEDVAAIKDGYKKALHLFETAVGHDEMERTELALACYGDCLAEVEQTFAIPVGLPEDVNQVETEWKEACRLVQRLHTIKQKVKARLRTLMVATTDIDYTATDTMTQVDGPTRQSLLQENPVVHYDAESAAGGLKRSYAEIVAGMRALMATRQAPAQFDTIFQAQCRLYKVLPDITVTTLSRHTPLSLVLCTTTAAEWRYLNGVYFIQCELVDRTAENCGCWSWIYPLIPGITNCWRTDYGAFIFPDMEAGEDQAGSFGIMLNSSKTTERALKDTASTSTSDDEDEELRLQFLQDLLEAILAGTVRELRSARSTRSIEDRDLPRSMVTVADFIAQNMVKGAEKTGDLMVKATPYIISKMKPAPVNAPEMPPKLQTSVKVAQKATGAAAGVTGWIAGKVGTASVAIGHYLAPHVQAQGSRLLEKSFGYDKAAASGKMEGAMSVAAGAIEGFCTVYNGVEQSARILGNSLSSNSVKIIEHKYGQSAGSVAAGTFDTVGNAFVISQNVNYVTPKGIAKKMVKKTGQALVDDYKLSLRSGDVQHLPAGMLYPDLRTIKDNNLL